MKKYVVFLFFLFFTFKAYSQIANITIKIPGKNIFLFGDRINFEVEISSLLKFSKVKVTLHNQNENPDFFSYEFKRPYKKENYISKGILSFIFFKKGDITTPSFTIELLDEEGKEEITVYKEKFGGIKIKQITTLKGKESIKGPISPQEKRPYFLTLILLIFTPFIAILFAFLFIKKRIKKKEPPLTEYESLSIELTKGENLLNISKIKEAVFIFSMILNQYLSKKIGQDTESLSTKELIPILKEKKIFKQEVERKIIESLNLINLIKYQPAFPVEKEEVKRLAKFIHFLIEDLKNDNI